jgi:hypothetical protein
MREYRFQATDESVEAFRRLRGPWAALRVTERAVAVTLANGTTVRIQVEPADVEDLFEAFRLEAVAEPEAVAVDAPGAPLDLPDGFSSGGNDIVLFTGVTWSESGAIVVESSADTGAVPSGSTMHFSGHPGQLPDSADVVCITTDAVVIAADTGEGLLVRTGLAPGTLQVLRERETIAEFLRDRGYSSE